MSPRQEYLEAKPTVGTSSGEETEILGPKMSWVVCGSVEADIQFSRKIGKVTVTEIDSIHVSTELSGVNKVIVHQPTREETIVAMRRALAELRVEGIKTTVPLLDEILENDAFVGGRVDTTFIERNWPS